MINKLFCALLSLFLFSPFIVASGSAVVDKASPAQVVMAFQKIPPYEMFCRDKEAGGAEPIKVGEKFEPYLSKEFYKLFLWSQCVEPEIPPFYDDFKNIYLWDIRFGNNGTGNTPKVTNLRLSPTKYPSPDKVIIKLKFDPTNYDLKNITTTYTLIREDGHWKIDDIAPKGDEPNEYNGDTALEHSDSIKTDMQKNYNAALARYNKEQAQHSAIPKP